MENVTPSHINYIHRNQTLYWSGSDQRKLWEQHMKDSKNCEYLTNAGWSNEYAIEYKFNSSGFRDEEFDQRPNCLAIGCSFTKGVGLKKDQIWPTKLTNLIGMHIWNLGVGGAAADTCFRMIDHYIKILNPKTVFLLVPPPARVELHTSNGVRSYLVTDTDIPTGIKEWFLHEDNSTVNRYKNILAIRQICADASIDLFIKDCCHTQYEGDLARDLMHYGEKTQDSIANSFYKDYTNGTT